ncbi:hypothetical protein ABII15_01435 [Streptomyces sp. HUAS MG91]|uniref:Uncharacterized protein n=1 Tax=Streptomyces tabacisoli TaxID=3156398 RepID=A0AAU8IKC6_9ACTN
MASVTYTRTRIPERRRAVAAPARAAINRTDADTPVTGREWPDSAQVWSWSATAVMWGYGPSASDLL